MPYAASVDATARSGRAGERPLLFISDLHLNAAQPHTVAAFERFITETAARATAVYILGDLFDAWVGDDMLKLPFAARIAATLRTLDARGIGLFVMRGNRDFLLNRRFAEAAAATLLDDPTIVQAFGRRVVLTHGDLLCTNDVGYQRFRRLAHWTPAQRLFLSLPFAWRLGFAGRLRAARRSSYSTADAELDRYDATPAAVARLFSSSASDLMIHGHTHRPFRHQENDGIRWVLSDWALDEPQPHAAYLSLGTDGIHSHAVID
ncbi:MAG: UDP-2,3-diacylglucosamine diphosphatase [Janthinobacterium lividum]